MCAVKRNSVLYISYSYTLYCLETTSLPSDWVHGLSMPPCLRERLLLAPALCSSGKTKRPLSRLWPQIQGRATTTSCASTGPSSLWSQSHSRMRQPSWRNPGWYLQIHHSYRIFSIIILLRILYTLSQSRSLYLSHISEMVPDWPSSRGQDSSPLQLRPLHTRGPEQRTPLTRRTQRPQVWPATSQISVLQNCPVTIL